MLLGKCSFFLFIMYCPTAVAIQCQLRGSLVRPHDCRVRAGHSGCALLGTRRKRRRAHLCNSSFALRLGPRCWCWWGREGACSRKCSGLSAPQASPASVEKSWSQSSPPSPTQQNCCCQSPVQGQPDFTLSRCCLLNSSMCWSSTPPPRLSEALGVWDFSPVSV